MDLQRRYELVGKRSKQLKRKIAKLHRKVKNQRLNFQHQTARRFVDGNDVIVLEELNVKNMSKRAKAKPDPETPGQFLPNGAAAKSGLNRSIADAAWAQFRTLIIVKAENAGRLVVFVDPAYTSIRCHICQATCTRPVTATVVCPTHGEIHADFNGAMNILGRGMASRVAA